MMELTDCELEKLAWVLSEADGGSCWSCTSDLLDAVKRAFPADMDHDKLFSFAKKFDNDSNYKKQFEINNLP
jgi:hypothetical protein